MDKELHFPFSILDSIFVIARGDSNSMPNEHQVISGAMTNIESKMENGKFFPFLLSRLTDLEAYSDEQ
jgi:hypothetical protein